MAGRPKKQLNLDVDELNPEEVKKYFKEQNERLEKYRGKRKEVLLDQLLKEVKHNKVKYIVCGAKTKKGICTNPPHYREDGTTNGRCYSHGGAVSGQKTEEGRQRALANLNPKANLIHGMYSLDIFTHEEITLIDYMYDKYKEPLELENNPVNNMMFSRMVINYILAIRKERHQLFEGEVEESNSYHDFDTKFLRYVEKLGLDRRFLLSKEHKDNNTMGDIALLLMGEQKDVQPQQVIDAEFEEVEEEK